MESEATAALDEISVPVKPRVYRGYRNINAFAAAFIAILFVMLCWVGYELLCKGFKLPPTAGWLGCFFWISLVGTACGMMLWSLTQLVLRMDEVLARNLPAIVITQEGIIDNASDNPTGLIRWDQIEQIALTNRYGNRREKSGQGVVILLNEHKRPKPGSMMLFFGLDLKLPIQRVFIRQEMIGKPALEVVKTANDFRARMNV